MNIRDLGSMTLKIFFYLDILNCVQYNFVKEQNSFSITHFSTIQRGVCHEYDYTRKEKTK